MLPIPLLTSLLPRSAWGQTQTIKRYFSLIGSYGYGHHSHWHPSLDLPSQSYNPGNGDHSIRYQSLRSYLTGGRNQLSIVLNRDLNPFLDKMNLLRGLNLHSRIAHGRGHILGNIQATDGHDNQVVNLKALPTIDQVLASNRRFTPHVNDPLNVGNNRSYVRGSDGNVSRAASRDWIKPDRLFNALFNPNGVPVPENGSSSTVQHPRRDILSAVIEDYRKVANGRKISSTDRQILNNVMDIISDTQRSLGITQTTQGCSYSGINTDQARNDGIPNSYYYNPESHAYAYNMYAQIYAAAAACDIHRVFDFSYIMSGHFDRHPSEDFHQGHSHQPWSVVYNNRPNHQYMAEIQGIFVSEFLAPLLTALDGTTEANGMTILDNSIVHYSLENSTVHSDFNKPCLLIGSAGGALTTGHHIDYTRRNLGPHPRFAGDNFSRDPNNDRFGHIYYGAHYNRSLTTILRALGLNPSDYEDPEINRFFQGRTDARLGSHNNGISRIGGYGHIGSQNAGGGWRNNDDMYNQEYSRYNYHFYKNPLPFPPRSS